MLSLIQIERNCGIRCNNYVVASIIRRVSSTVGIRDHGERGVYWNRSVIRCNGDSLEFIEIHLCIHDAEFVRLGIPAHIVVGRVGDKVKNKLIPRSAEQIECCFMERNLGLAVFVKGNGHILFAGAGGRAKIQWHLLIRVCDVQIVESEHSVDNR